MKIRTGFVSNSSSTAFCFLFKGDTLDDLYAVMRNYPKRFEVSLDMRDSYSYEINEIFPIETLSVDVVIEAMKSAQVQFEDDEWRSLKIAGIDEMIEDAKHELKGLKDDLEERMKENKGMNDAWWTDYRKELIEVTEKHLAWLLDCKGKGFNSAYEIDFGDNHGHIEGNPIGTIMDCHSSRFNFNNKDLCCYTKNKH